MRQYEDDDIEAIERLAWGFYDEILKVFNVDYSKDKVMNGAISLNEETLVLLVDDKIVGFITGKTVDCPFSDKKFFQEIAWYVTKDHRAYGGNLLKALENRCKKRGIAGIIMVALANSMTERLDRYYLRQGFVELEKHYIKVIV